MVDRRVLLAAVVVALVVLCWSFARRSVTAFLPQCSATADAPASCPTCPVLTVAVTDRAVAPESLTTRAGYFEVLAQLHAEAEVEYQNKKDRLHGEEANEYAQLKTSLPHSLNIWRFYPVIFPVTVHRVGGYFDGGKYSASFATLKKLPKLQPTFETPCVVYSFGSNRQVDFELSVLEGAPFCQVHIFDFSVAFEDLPEPARVHPNIHFHRVGLGGSESTVNWYNTNYRVAPVLTFMHELGHSYLDILKVDVEFSEYAAMQSMYSLCQPDSRACDLPFGEIMMEMHIKERREHASVVQMFSFLESAGFRHVSTENNWGVIEPWSGVEVVWIKPQFWSAYDLTPLQRAQRFNATFDRLMATNSKNSL